MSAAWAAPVVTIAAAAPAASASPSAGFDLVLDPPQLGSSFYMFNGALTRLLEVGEPVATVVANHGTVASPAGFTLQVSYDSAVFRLTGATGHFGGSGGDGTSLPIVTRSVADRVETVTFTIPVMIPPGTDPFTGYFVAFDYDILGIYPHDAVADYRPAHFTLLPVPGDADLSNNTAVGSIAQDKGPVSPWGVLASASYATKAIGSLTLKRPTTITWTSVGPNPTPAGSQLRIGTDAQTASQVRITNVRFNGAPAPGAVTFVSQESTGQTIAAVYALTVRLAARDVLTYDVTYVDQTPPAGISQIYRAQADFLAPDPNSPAQRARDERSYLQY
ncbi:hypothetical protein [Branchiibius sp. NY16-3462-2]|uniref:hypothetical protein n=1 Tax=Branchiibius sp. NY16-3462-2 TaxID=1807500 RepID=UPI000794727B|nr:hypothetical protein [Branchiibius sp. NY16-3462-2]KYH45835.1 hypothetical protein AZH51_09100 [Branchiibius sp. NY16-3462-2]